MGIRSVIGNYDGGDEAAVLVDSGADWAFGPVWKGPDAEEQIDRFMGWLRLEPYLLHAPEIGLTSHDIPAPLADATDPRNWPISGLMLLVAYWRAANLDEHGTLVDQPEGEPTT